jgi:ABC-type Co2+ transport system permease subunit
MDVTAMHIANGIVDGPVSAVFAVVAAVALAYAAAPTWTIDSPRWPAWWRRSSSRCRC